MTNIKKYLMILSLTVVGGFLLAATYTFFVRVFLDGPEESQSVMVGAFLGAFFTFIFLRVADAFKFIYDKKLENSFGLVRVQHYLNNVLGLLEDNMYLIDKFVAAAEKSNDESKPIAIFDDSYNELPIEREVLFKLHNVELINELYSLYVDLRRIGKDLSTSQQAYIQLKDAYINKNIDRKMYITNVISISNELTELRSFIEATKEELLNTSVNTRILHSKVSISIIGMLMKYFTQMTYSEDMKELRITEMRNLKEEIQKNYEISRKKINKTINNSSS